MRQGRRQGRLIGICGLKRAGKDSVAEALCQMRVDFVRLAFADAMKQVAYALDPHVYTGIETIAPFERLTKVVDRDGWEAAKEHPDVRRLLQRLGTEGGRMVLGDDVWVDRLMRDAVPLLNSGRSVVIPDVRFKNEIAAVRLHGGQLWRVDRPGLTDDTTETGRHRSEHEWRGVKPDVVIVNSGTLADLATHVERVLKARAGRRAKG